MFDSPVSIPEQQRCKFCGGIIPPGDRRPREYCSDAHRQADYRKRRQEADAGPNGLVGRPAEHNSPAANPPKTALKIPTKSMVGIS